MSLKQLGIALLLGVSAGLIWFWIAASGASTALMIVIGGISGLLFFLMGYLLTRKSTPSLRGAQEATNARGYWSQRARVS